VVSGGGCVGCRLRLGCVMRVWYQNGVAASTPVMALASWVFEGLEADCVGLGGEGVRGFCGGMMTAWRRQKGLQVVASLLLECFKGGAQSGRP
jgi:hypothetical protein